MGFRMKGQVEWTKIHQPTGEIIDHGIDDNIILDIGRKYFLGGWMRGSSQPVLMCASGSATPDYTDTTVDTLIAWSFPATPAGTTQETPVYTSPTVTFECTFTQPPQDYIINKVALGRAGSIAGSAPSGTCTKPYCVVKLSTPIEWETTSQLNIIYRVTLEKYSED